MLIQPFHKHDWRGKRVEVSASAPLSRQLSSWYAAFLGWWINGAPCSCRTVCLIWGPVLSNTSCCELPCDVHTRGRELGGRGQPKTLNMRLQSVSLFLAGHLKTQTPSHSQRGVLNYRGLTFVSLHNRAESAWVCLMAGGAIRPGDSASSAHSCLEALSQSSEFTLIDFAREKKRALAASFHFTTVARPSFLNQSLIGGDFFFNFSHHFL